MNGSGAPERQGLYDPANEHDACGVGFVANIKGKKSHAIVQQGLQILRNLTHRGAVGADPLAGDGAGILIQIPDPFFREELATQGVRLPPLGQYGVGMVFLPKEPASRLACEYEIERAIKDEGQILLGWRDVPCDDTGLGESVKKIEPVIRQVFIGRGKGVTVTDALERKLYIIRKAAGHAIQALKLAHGKEFYVPSMSARTIVYKGMLLAHQVGTYYKDLQDPRVASALALVHQRFSTNTFPTWDLAHPFRLIAHNGEINTLRGNVNWIRARQGAISSPILKRDLDKVWPLIYDGQSDSASFDNAFELLVMSGYSIAHAMMMMIPEAWENHHAHGREPPRVLRVPRGDDGAVGRPGVDRLHRRAPDRRDARPQRAAAFALHRHRRRSRHHGLGMRVPADTRGAHRQEVAPAAGQDVPGRPRKRPHHRRQGAEGQLASARPYAEWIDRIRIKLDDLPAPSEKRAVPNESLLDLQQAFALHAGRRQVHHGADGPRTAKSRSARWATIRRSRCSRTRTRRCTTTSSSFSRRSPTRRSTRSAKSS